MTIMHHPSDAALAAFAAGMLDEGRRLVVATHLAGCAACRKSVQGFEAVGGIVLEESQPMPMQTGALQRALSALDADQAPMPHVRASVPSVNAETLASYSLGKWRWVGPGIHVRPVDVPGERDTRVFMLKAAPGTALPHHRHTDYEWTCLLKGAYRHAQGRYGAGDFDEADDSVEHDPVVEDGEECICLVAMRGQIQFKSWIGRLLQPLVRI